MMLRTCESFLVSTSLLMLLLTGGCAATPDSTAQESSPPPSDQCLAADAEAACGSAGDGGCCYAASIKYQYEMLDARQKGDAATAKQFERRYLDLIHRACELRHAQACKDLERAT
jgi:hypothetical protein